MVQLRPPICDNSGDYLLCLQSIQKFHESRSQMIYAEEMQNKINKKIESLQNWIDKDLIKPIFNTSWNSMKGTIYSDDTGWEKIIKLSKLKKDINTKKEEILNMDTTDLYENDIKFEDMIKILSNDKIANKVIKSISPNLNVSLIDIANAVSNTKKGLKFGMEPVVLRRTNNKSSPDYGTASNLLTDTKAVKKAVAETIINYIIDEAGMIKLKNKQYTLDLENLDNNLTTLGVIYNNQKTSMSEQKELLENLKERNILNLSNQIKEKNLWRHVLTSDTIAQIIDLSNLNTIYLNEMNELEALDPTESNLNKLITLFSNDESTAYNDKYRLMEIDKIKEKIKKLEKQRSEWGKYHGFVNTVVGNLLSENEDIVKKGLKELATDIRPPTDDIEDAKVRSKKDNDIDKLKFVMADVEKAFKEGSISETQRDKLIDDATNEIIGVGGSVNDLGIFDELVKSNKKDVQSNGQSSGQSSGKPIDQLLNFINRGIMIQYNNDNNSKDQKQSYFNYKILDLLKSIHGDKIMFYKYSPAFIAKNQKDRNTKQYNEMIKSYTSLDLIKLNNNNSLYYKRDFIKEVFPYFLKNDSKFFIGYLVLSGTQKQIYAHANALIIDKERELFIRFEVNNDNDKNNIDADMEAFVKELNDKNSTKYTYYRYMNITLSDDLQTDLPNYKSSNSVIKNILNEKILRKKNDVNVNDRNLPFDTNGICGIIAAYFIYIYLWIDSQFPKKKDIFKDVTNYINVNNSNKNDLAGDVYELVDESKKHYFANEATIKKNLIKDSNGGIVEDKYDDIVYDTIEKEEEKKQGWFKRIMNKKPADLDLDLYPASLKRLIDNNPKLKDRTRFDNSSTKDTDAINIYKGLNNILVDLQEGKKIVNLNNNIGIYKSQNDGLYNFYTKYNLDKEDKVAKNFILEQYNNFYDDDDDVIKLTDKDLIDQPFVDSEIDLIDQNFKMIKEIK